MRGKRQRQLFVVKLLLKKIPGLCGLIIRGANNTFQEKGSAVQTNQNHPERLLKPYNQLNDLSIVSLEPKEKFEERGLD
jgi:hypothetical protein